MRRFFVGFCAGLGCSTQGQTVRALTTANGPVDGDDSKHSFDYDLIVIGGGSGGLAAAKRANHHGAKVALCDFVQPSSQGTVWGIGGTCVNVGCIPKKLMHTAGLYGEMLQHSLPAYGFHQGEAPPQGEQPTVIPAKVNWMTLQQNVTNHIRSLNFGYVVQLRELGITYHNAYAKFVDPHTIECVNKKGESKKLTARRFLVATGGRPTIPEDIPGAKEHAITSDDIFSLKRDPGNTLVVGASYVALECAGFLHGIGRKATVMVRSIPLRGFDQDMASKITDFMEKRGVGFIPKCVPSKIAKKDDGQLEVSWENKVTKRMVTKCYDTVLFATGRTPETVKIGLDDIGVQMAKNKKVQVDQYDRTSIPHIYAIGDIIEHGLELTPVAIKAGQLLADRLYATGTETLDYQTVPTTVFTPLEYGCVGYSEEDAHTKYGREAVHTYHTFFQPLEWTVPHLEENACYMKLVCLKEEKDKVVGFHVLAPNAGEITQGVAVALKLGAKKSDFDNTIGIHPTVAEAMTTMEVTKESGVSAVKSGC